MAGESTVTLLDGLFKTVYAKSPPERIIPDNCKLQDAVKFNTRGKIGKEYKHAVALGLEHGYTNAEPEAGAFTIDAAVPGSVQQASVKAYQGVIRSAVAYDAAFQAPGGSGEAAFAGATETILKNMVESVRKRLEVEMLGYGRSGIGVIENANPPGEGYIQITAASWSPGFWVGMKGAILSAFDSAAIGGGVTQRTPGTAYTVVSVDFSTRRVTLSEHTQLATGDVVYLKTQRSGTVYKTMVGLDQICTEATSLFGITIASYPDWAGNSYAVGGDLSVDGVRQALAKASPRGMRGNLKLYVSPKTHANLSAGLDDLTQFSPSEEKSIGTKKMGIICPTGIVAVEQHEMCKEGEGFLFNPSLLLRSGPTDLTFNRQKWAPNVGTESFFREMENTAAYEVRAYSSQFLFTAKPCCFMKLTGIVNS